MLNILANRLIVVAWLGPGYAFGDSYITVLNILARVCEDRGQVTMDSF